MKPTLLEICEEAITVEKDLHAIGVIKDDEQTKDFKDASRKSQEMVRKGRDKEEIDIETLTLLIKILTMEVFKLKKQNTNTSTSSHPPRQRQVSSSSGSN